MPDEKVLKKKLYLLDKMLDMSNSDESKETYERVCRLVWKNYYQELFFDEYEQKMADKDRGKV